MERAKQLLESIVRELVDFPDEIRIESTSDEMGVLLTIFLNSEDVGKVIGREGNTAKAIRTLLRIVGIKEKARINLKIAEPQGYQYNPRRGKEERPGGSSHGNY